MTPKQRWDILASIRGPDCYRSEIVKFWSTGVIRYRLSSVMRVGGKLNSAIELIIIPTGIVAPPQKLRWNAAHFFEHIEEAAAALEIPKIYVRWVDYLEAL